MPKTLKVPSAGTVTIPDPVTTQAAATFVPDSVTNPNQPPVVNAGSNATIQLPLNSAQLQGVSTDVDGTIANTLWSQISGPTGVIIANPKSATTAVTFTNSGVYTFKYAATDNNGATSFSQVNITVLAAVVIPPPVTGKVIIQTGYDVLSDIINSHNQIGGGGLSTSIYKTAPGSFMSKVTGNVSSGWRSEVQYENDSAPLNKDMVYEYDMMIGVMPNVDGHVIQIHGETSGASATWALWLKSGVISVVRQVDTKNRVNIYGNSIMKLSVNQWYHCQWKSRLTTDKTGYVQLSIDGNLVYDTGKTATCDGTGQYLKVGQNMFSQPNPASIIYYDNLIVTQLN
jgi:hypothetical protein